jgi:hypothetical protein
MLAYHMLYRWYETEIGRNLMALFGCMFGFLSLRMLVLLFGPQYWGRDFVRTALYVAVCVVIFIRLSLLFSTLREGREIQDQKIAVLPDPDAERVTASAEVVYPGYQTPHYLHDND